VLIFSYFCFEFVRLYSLTCILNSTTQIFIKQREFTFVFNSFTSHTRSFYPTVSSTTTPSPSSFTKTLKRRLFCRGQLHLKGSLLSFVGIGFPFLLEIFCYTFSIFSAQLSIRTINFSKGIIYPSRRGGQLTFQRVLYIH